MLFIETDMISLAGRKEVATVETENWAFWIFSERELCQSVVCLWQSVCPLCHSHLLSVTFMHPTQAIEIFGNVSTPFNTMAICWHWQPGKILRRSSQGNPFIYISAAKSIGVSSTTLM